MDEAELPVDVEPSPSPPLKTTKRHSKANHKRKKTDDQKEEEEIKNKCSKDGGEEGEKEDCVKAKYKESQSWKPLVFSKEEDESMLALQVVIENVSAFDADRKQHFLFLPHKLTLRNLTHTVLHKVGFRNLAKYTLEGRLQIGVLKPFPFSTVTDNLDDTIGHLLMSIISSVILYIKVKKTFDDTNEEERLEYREIALLRGTGYLISDYFFVCDRQSDRKDILYLRCSRQRKGDCSSRAKIVRELGCAVLVNQNHNHPPPNVKMHEFMHRCRNESREPKNFTRHLKDVYDEICGDVLSNCSPDELSEVQDAIQDWDTVKKIMQKCRSRAVCSAPRLDRGYAEDCDQPNVSLPVQQSNQNNSEKTKQLKLESSKITDTAVNGGLSRPQVNSTNQNCSCDQPNVSLPVQQSIQNNSEKSKRLKLESCKITDTAVSGGLSRPQVISTNQNFTTFRDTAYQGIPPVTQLNHMVTGGLSLPSGSAVPMMVHAGTVDDITSEARPVGPIPLIGAPSMSHQGYANHYHMNSNWTTTPDNFMLNVQTSNMN